MDSRATNGRFIEHFYVDKRDSANCNYIVRKRHISTRSVAIAKKADGAAYDLRYSCRRARRAIFVGYRQKCLFWNSMHDRVTPLLMATPDAEISAVRCVVSERYILQQLWLNDTSTSRVPEDVKMKCRLRNMMVHLSTPTPTLRA